MQKSSNQDQPANVWEGPEPDFSIELPGRCGTLDPNVVKQQTDFTKIHHRSDELLHNWARFDAASVFDDRQRADLVRLALIDLLHQRQLQKRAIAAGLTDHSWNSIHPQYFHDYYAWMFVKNDDETIKKFALQHKDIDCEPLSPDSPEYDTIDEKLVQKSRDLIQQETAFYSQIQYPDENAIENANFDAIYPHTPITKSNYGSDFSTKTLTRHWVPCPNDIELGFPDLFPLGADVDTTSWFASIDRIPAHLFSRKLCKRVYEYPGKAVIVQNLPELYEQQAEERKQNELDISAGLEPRYKVLSVEGGEILSRDLQDTPRDIETINDLCQRRQKFQPPTAPHLAHFPLSWWNMGYLAGLSEKEIHQLTSSSTPKNNETKSNNQDIVEVPHPFDECFFRIGERDDGQDLRVRAKTYYQYVWTNRDDSPLYLFESNLYHSKLSSRIPQLFHPPTWLVADIVRDVMKISERPPFQWYLQGAKRSGTRMHLDPRGTTAWNQSCSGLKRWVLLRAGVPSNITKGTIVMTNQEYKHRLEYGNPQCSYWFEHILPRLRRFIFHREQKRLAVLRRLKDAGVYTFVPNGHCVCKCGYYDDELEDRKELGKDYLVVKQDDTSFLCECDCLCGCKLQGLTQMGISLKDINLRMDPSTTADDSFGQNTSLIPQTIRDLETRLETEDPLQRNEDGLSIQQQIDLLVARHIALSKGPITGSGSPQWDELRDGYAFQEFIQYPHETIIVPSNIWHAVVNVSDSVAITENFANTSNFDRVLRSMRVHNRGTTRRWLRRLEQASHCDEPENTKSSWLLETTNDGRNVEEPMTPKQLASWYRGWYKLAQEINAHDNFHLSLYRGKQVNGRTTTASSDSKNEISPSASTTDPEQWLFTDEDEL